MHQRKIVLIFQIVLRFFQNPKSKNHTTIFQIVLRF